MYERRETLLVQCACHSLMNDAHPSITIHQKARTYARIEAVAKLVDATGNLVKMDRFTLAVAFDHVMSHVKNSMYVENEVKG
jgi:hypothetical protein